MRDWLSVAVGGLLLVSIVVGAFLWWHEREGWLKYIAHLERRLDDATNRLLAASEAGRLIPPSDLTLREPDPMATLDPLIEEWCAQWEGADAQAKWRNIARGYVALGLEPVAVCKSLEGRLG